MAIKDMKGTVTTTGMMNEKPVAKAPDMSGIKMTKGPVLPEDPTKPVNPFAPKPVGPVLPDRQMAAYGGIMGMDGRKQYGIGSFFQSVKDKFVDDIIPNEIK